MSKEKILLFILAAIQFTHIVDFMIVMPLGPQLMRLLEINPQQFALMVSSYTFSAGVVGFLFAFVADRFDRKSVLLFSFLCFTAGTISCGFANSYGFLLAARIFTGAFGGVMNALVYSIIADAFPFERRGAAMGVVMASFSFAAAIGVPLGLFLASLADWHLPFHALGGAGILISIGIYLYIPALRAHIGKGAEDERIFDFLLNIGRTKNLLKALLFMFLMVMGQFVVIPFISPYMVSNMGISEKELTYVYLLGGGATFFTNPWIGRLSDKYGKPKVFTILALLSVIPLFIVTNVQETALWIVLLVSVFFFVTISGRVVPGMTMITSAVEPQHRGSFMSINSAVQQFSSAGAAMIGGMIVMTDASGKLLNYQYAGYLAIAATLLCVVVSRRLKAVE
jgi:predicted MFS family arabinose efflux permease